MSIETIQGPMKRTDKMMGEEDRERERGRVEERSILLVAMKNDLMELKYKIGEGS